ncbi:TIGR00282 family metallophosphoesterase [Swingsia samuiensis]|uniref:TIGR00282 family metallophosphoesterase n=1 Tax=Swingsia samuiensis TaxID=1293412 RepID=A0A4Y6UIP7_9PROT|nr:TIGR00282 family metallophosphoesterase [Swingsia samuiensis]QDH16346.1 TIGR00282 family metallophosphoesterase [Swingsia samuiensis]
MRILFLGDIVGRNAREAIIKHLPDWRKKLNLDLVVANGENASHGYGLSPDIARNLTKVGVDVVTLGNHAWDRRDLMGQISQMPNVIRPINYPSGTPGQGSYIVELTRGRRALVINVMGRIFMDPLDDPFRVVSELLSKHRLGTTVNAIVLDVHAEATSEKMGMGHYFDGKVSLIIGTHTHVPTADHRILPQGTAYQTDAGMCGAYDSVIGMGKEASLHKLIRKIPGERPHPAEGEPTICGLMVETDDSTGLALRVAPFRYGGDLLPNWPDL